MKCYAVSTEGKNLILTKPQFDEFYASKPVGYQCLKCNSFEEAEIALHKIQKGRTHKNITQNSTSECIMFYDSEFNCPDEKDTIQEIVSIGAVICDKEENEISTFYSTVKPLKSPRLSKRCKDLTGLCQKDIDMSENLYWVSKHFYEWYSKYNVTSAYTLGKNDSLQLERSIPLFKQSKYIQKTANVLKDVRPVFEKLVDKTISPLSLSNLKSICRLDEYVNHNALFDAIDLKKVYFRLLTGQYDKDTVQKMTTERKERQKYSQARNVKDEKILVPKEIMDAKNKLVEYLVENNDGLDKAVLNAMIDDLNELFIVCK